MSEDVGDSPDLEASDVPDPEQATEQTRSLRSMLRRQAVDTRPLQIPPFRRLLIGQGTSFIGAQLTQVAVPVEVYAISRSSLDVGLVGLVGLLPIVVFGLYGGAIADAIDRRTLYFWSSIVSWAMTLGLLMQSIAELNNITLILALVAVQSGSFAIASSARGAIIPRLVDAELVPAANTLNYTLGQVGQVLGPLIAGILVVQSHGFAYAYAIDAVLFTAALYSALRLPSIPPDHSGRKLGLRSVVEGLAFIGTRSVLLMSFLVDICAMVLAMPRALFPAVADQRFHGQVGPLYAGDRRRFAARRHQRRLDRAGEAAGAGADVRRRRLGRGRGHQRARAPTVARRRAARARRCRRPRQRRLPADDPADVRPGRDARPDAGRVHRRRRRRPAPG